MAQLWLVFLIRSFTLSTYIFNVYTWLTAQHCFNDSVILRQTHYRDRTHLSVRSSDAERAEHESMSSDGCQKCLQSLFTAMCTYLIYNGLLPWCSETAAEEELFLEYQGQLLLPANFWGCYTEKTPNNQRRYHETLGKKKPSLVDSLIFKTTTSSSGPGSCTKKNWWFGFYSYKDNAAVFTGKCTHGISSEHT